MRHARSIDIAKRTPARHDHQSRGAKRLAGDLELASRRRNSPENGVWNLI